MCRRSHLCASSWRAAMCFRPRMSAGDRRAGRGQIINGYGPTEGTTFSVCFPTTARRSRRDRSDRPSDLEHPGLRLGRRLAACPAGVAGELYIGGVGLARGYLGARARRRSGLLRTHLGLPGAGCTAPATWRAGVRTAAGVLGAGGCAGEAARVPDRAGRDRGCADGYAGVAQAAVVAREDAGGQAAGGVCGGDRREIGGLSSAR